MLQSLQEFSEALAKDAKQVDKNIIPPRQQVGGWVGGWGMVGRVDGGRAGDAVVQVRALCFPLCRIAVLAELKAFSGSWRLRATQVAAALSTLLHCPLAQAALEFVNVIENAMVKGFPFEVPKEYDDLPQLKVGPLGWPARPLQLSAAGHHCVRQCGWCGAIAALVC